MSFSVVTKNAEAFGLSLPQSASLTAPSSEGALGTRNDHFYVAIRGFWGEDQLLSRSVPAGWTEKPIPFS